MDASAEVVKRCRERAKRMLSDLTPKQRALVQDPAPHVAGICPRRAGKSYAGAAAALITGEAKPGSICVIISLNLKQLRRLYWAGGASGLFTFDRKYGLNITFNSGYLRWEHENGSIGYLLGAEDREQLEVIRGMEADLYLIDECKSFVPSVLLQLVDEIIDPQRASRNGRIILIGTPGNLPSGPFYEATCPLATDRDGKRYLVDFGEKDPHGRTAEDDLLWSRHFWTLQDNTAQPHLWATALKKKRQKQWADDDPVWLREYLGQWTATTEGLVFRYLVEMAKGRVTWQPIITEKSLLGLPVDGAPWRFVAGLDLGFEAPTALVVLAYSQRLRCVRHVFDYSASHLLVHDVVDLLQEATDRLDGHSLEAVFGDMGNLGKMVCRTLVHAGFPVEAADKREKFDHIEIANSMFVRGEIQIIEGTVLDHQLKTNQWDLEASSARLGRDAKMVDLARLGKLVEDKSIPNDSSDAFIYALRGALHSFGIADATPAAPTGSPEAIRQWEQDQLAKYRRNLAKPDQRFSGNHLNSAPPFARRALGLSWTKSTSSIFKTS